MSDPPRPHQPELVLTTPCRLVEPHLCQPVRRARATAAPSYGFMLLLERDQVGPIWGAIRNTVKAWPRGRGLLDSRCIRDPLRRIPDAQMARWGGAYRDGFYLRVNSTAQPPVFGPGNSLIAPGDVHPGTLVECGLSVHAVLTEIGERAVNVSAEWIDVHILARPGVARWATVQPPRELVQ